MLCPYCKEMDSRVVDSRLASGGAATWRRRECDQCKRRFTTYERVELVLPTIVKKDGKRQPFVRDKVLRSLTVACSKRPVTPEQLDEMAGSIEQELSLLGEKEVPAHMIGERVMARLKDVDEVAYVRFASVYKSFRDIDEFMREVGTLVRARPEVE
jgi:transcriptional repressor NrdR